MQLHLVTLLSLILVKQSSSSLSKELNVRMCTRNRTMSIQILANEDYDDASCRCLAGRTNDIIIVKEDYLHTAGIGAHKLHTEAMTWNDARRACMEEGGHLVVINSKAEETILLELLKNGESAIRAGANKNQAYIGIHDFFEEGEWLTIHGEPLNATGYAEWSKSWYGRQPDNYQGQNCGALVILGGMDDVKCDERLAFFCELPIGCGTQ